MLDSETKSKIDSARDILVGKVPDPKSQVEQITIALIYKFMDDMDRQSEEIGGKVSFFTGEFRKYRWAQLLDKRLSGHERLLLYAEGIEKMNVNKNTPQLFRDIFKGVFLPYRDPETLNLFLKEIDGFSYDHSERLGDAFEYLLSVMDSQGNAGQFRTPRHIIDFIVAVVDPKKNETILDPACGTAGFLISAYKHIAIQNPKSKIKNELSPDERARLMTNFCGYDISPDMVRLSRVNMYLHGFANPRIHEYDTLTSEERWDERFDVIMANPPFMSPKGGIRPHNRFSIKAKRSEVLFVDYIAEHLNPGGRAGIIVPEGIIFQSQNAYKALRKMLVENYLWAVISLPAGVFNPYSGVKTSILFLDRNMAKRTDQVLFVKVENDGFDLGAQRRAIEGSQLAETFKILNGHQNTQEGKMSLTISRKRLLESPDINLSGERYRAPATRSSGKWPMVKLGELLDYEQPTNYIVQSVDYNDKYPIPVLTAGKSFILGYTNEKEGVFHDGLPVIIFDDFTTAIKYVDFPFKVKSSAMKILHAKKGVANIRYIFFAMQKVSFSPSEHKRYWISQYSKFEIPLPHLDEQERIVAELEGYRKIIEGARQIIASYKPTIRIDPEWPMVTVTDSCALNPKKVEVDNCKGSTEVSFVPMSDIGEHMMYFETKQRKRLDEVTTSYTYFKDGDVLIAKVTPCFENGKAGIARGLHNGIGFGSSEFYVIRPSKSVLSEWVFMCLTSSSFHTWATPKMTGTGGLQRVPRSVVENYPIPLPPLDIQRAIVAELQAERKLVEANRELITRMEKKIKDRLDEVWGENRE